MQFSELTTQYMYYVFYGEWEYMTSKRVFVEFSLHVVRPIDDDSKTMLPV